MKRGSRRSSAAMTSGSTKPLKWLATISTGRSSGMRARPTSSMRRKKQATSARATSPMARSTARRGPRCVTTSAAASAPSATFLPGTAGNGTRPTG